MSDLREYLSNDANYSNDYAWVASDLLNYLDEDELVELYVGDTHQIFDSAINETVDGAIDIYYYDLRTWAVDNYDYIDQAIDEGLCEGSDFHKQIQAGQYVYYSEQMTEFLDEVAGLVAEFEGETV
jgi:hypothetical protein